MVTLETERLYLRSFVSGDLDDFAALNADPEVMLYIGDGQPQTKQQTTERLRSIIDHHDKHGFALCAAIEKTSRAFLGFCGLQFLDNTQEVEVGYRLAKRFWRKGFATEAAKASVRYGFEELGFDRIVAVVHPENEASQRVIQKIGLQYVKQARFYNTDVLYYALTRTEFQPDETGYNHQPVKV